MEYAERQSPLIPRHVARPGATAPSIWPSFVRRACLRANQSRAGVRPSSAGCPFLAKNRRRPAGAQSLIVTLSRRSIRAQLDLSPARRGAPPPQPSLFQEGTFAYRGVSKYAATIVGLFLQEGWRPNFLQPSSRSVTAAFSLASTVSKWPAATTSNIPPCTLLRAFMGQTIFEFGGYLTRSACQVFNGSSLTLSAVLHLPANELQSAERVSSP
jgi:hypothetical protein